MPKQSVINITMSEINYTSACTSVLFSLFSNQHLNTGNSYFIYFDLFNDIYQLYSTIIYVPYLRLDVFPHKTSFTQPLVIDVLVPSQKSERPCMCVIGVLSVVFFVFNFIILDIDKLLLCLNISEILFAGR